MMQSFEEWEEEFLTNINDVEDDENTTAEESIIEKEPESVDYARLNEIHQYLRQLKEFSVAEGHSDLFVCTQKTLSNLEWIISSAKGLKQPPITNYFRRSI